MSDVFSAKSVHGNGYDPEKIVEELKEQARKLVADVYDEFYTPGYLKRLLAGHLDYEKEVETAVKAILDERKRCQAEIKGALDLIDEVLDFGDLPEEAANLLDEAWSALRDLMPEEE